MKFINVPQTLEASLDSAAKSAQNLLTNLAVNQHFSQIITTAFEDEFNTEKIERLRQAWADGDFSHLPEVEIRSSQDINRGAGAFSKNTNKIYLAEEFAVLHRNHTSAIADILLEETGHWIDAEINTEEAPGDEGAIFSALVRGKILNPQQLQELKTENDHATVILDGEEIEIEQAIVSYDGEVVFYENETIPSDVSRYESPRLDGLQAFDEAQNVILSEDIVTNNPQLWEQTLTPAIPSGTEVSSHYIWIAPSQDPRLRVTAQFTFDQPIVGFLGWSDELLATNDLLGLNNMIYSDLTTTRLDNHAQYPQLDDSATLIDDYTVEISFSNDSGLDPIRILTSSDNIALPEFPTTEPEPESPAESEPETLPDNVTRLEAEQFNLTNYGIDAGDFASGGHYITISSSEGTATTNWTAEAGTYELTVGYYDESDGLSDASIKIDDVIVDSWTFDQPGGGTRASANNRVERTVTVDLNSGSTIELMGTQEAGENGRFDYVDLVLIQPAENINPIASADSFNVVENNNLIVDVNVGVLSNDTDANGDSLTISSYDTAATAGSLTLNNDGSFSYTPPTDFTGVDGFNYTISDGNGGVDTATAYIHVTPEQNSVEIQTEDMTLRNYAIRDRNFASDGQLIRHRNNDRVGTATTTWDGESGVYDIEVVYYDESDGSGTAEVNIDGNRIDNWTLDNNAGSANPSNDNRVERTLTQPVNLYPGSQIQLSGWRDGGENTWFDSIKLTPSQSGIVRVEAEDMVLNNYIVRDRTFASGGQLIKHRNNDRAGTATTTWTGEAGTYNIQVAYHDENDGNATGQLTVDGQLIDSWSFDENPKGTNPNKNNRIERVLEVPVTLTPGSEIEFTGWRDGGENAWLDHIQFIPVEPVENTNPEAVDNQYSVAEDNTLTIAMTAGVLSNDTDANGDNLTVSNYDNSSTEGGSVNVNGDGSFSYTPAANFAGTDSFNYTVSDGKGGVDSATVTIEVTAENDAPEAVDDSYSLAENTELTFNAISNDSDVDGDTLTIDNYDTASFNGGSVSLNGDGSFTYIPVADFTGSDSFTYNISDGNGGTDTATVNLTVTEVNTDETRIEAENLTLDNYVEEDGDFASAGKLITIGNNGDTGTASHTWTGLGGSYELTVAYFNESDGAGNATVKVDGVEVDSWTLNNPSSGNRPNAGNLEERTVSVDLNSGSTIEVVGVRDAGENVRLDYLAYTPIVTEPDVTPPTASLAAETLTVGLGSNLNYNFTVNFSDETGVDTDSFDSNDIQVTGPNGFSQMATLLSVTDSSATYQIQAPNEGWQNNNFGSYTVTVKADEVSDIDGNFITETPLGNFQVNVGETVSYAFSDKGIIARLDQDFVFTPEFEETLEIMLLGDSITQGKVNNSEPEAEREGYRRFLWDALNDLGLDIDFVGSESNGTGGFDQDHQGHPGWKIEHLTNGKNDTPDSGIDNWISAEQAQPDLILAMAGTNNASSQASTIANHLDNLIDEIFTNPVFDGELIVSTIAPIHPNSSYYDSRLPNVIDYNNLIPGIVEEYANQGEDIHFVDIWSGDYAITENDMTAPPDDNGLHPSVNGYQNMAQTFYNAILDAVGVSESVSDVSNIIGSDLDDIIVGNNSSNEIVGGVGADEITGNNGADLFIYETASDGEDILTDFDATEGDIIQISASGFGGGLEAGISLSDSIAAATGVFVSGSNPQPIGNSANVLYDSTSGVLSFDVDGEGVENPVTLATLTGAPALAFNDLIIA